jgi:hypothetical protein
LFRGSWKELKNRNLAIVLGMFFATLITIAALYALIMGAFANINLVGAVAAVSIAVAGIVWFKKTVSSHK